MNPETAVTFTRGHFNQVFFAVYNSALLLSPWWEKLWVGMPMGGVDVGQHP